jgi:hypothetical protein
MSAVDWRNVVWQQFGAAIDMLENAIRACPDHVWNDRSRRPEFWYVAYHTLFFLDLYLSDAVEGFAPPAPFGMEELDFEGRLPERVYSKDELLRYLEHGRSKCRALTAAMHDAGADQRCNFGWLSMPRGELMLYNMRHVQHHAGQLNLMLRLSVDTAPGWVSRAGEKR